MQVGNTFAGVDHGQGRASGVDGINVGLDRGPLLAGQLLQFLEQISETVVEVDPDSLEHLSVFVQHLLVVDRDAVTKHDGVRDFHHGRLEVQRE